jgi:preprotein translocase subunit Sec61beta
MAEDSKINLPGGMGGLTRFSEEYESKFNLKPIHVIVMIILIIAFRISLKFIYG